MQPRKSSSTRPGEHPRGFHLLTCDALASADAWTSAIGPQALATYLGGSEPSQRGDICHGLGGIRAEIMSGRESMLALAGSSFDALSVSKRWKMVLAA